jgi:N-formylglutamate amidohydrolase
MATSGTRPFQSSTGEVLTIKGGRLAAEVKQAAFTCVVPHRLPLPVLIAVPHGGRAYPAAVLAQMRDPELSQLRLEDRHVDQLGIEIARQTGTALLVAHAPRAMLDLNRDEDDVDWDMIEGPRPSGLGAAGKSGHINRRSRSGLGIVPRRLPGFGEIWRSRLARTELDRRIDEIHRPYHAMLAQQLRSIRDQWGAALLIDLHSMPPLRAPDDGEQAPQIVLGDRFGASCHAGLVGLAMSFFERRGCLAAHNRPYSGGYVLDHHADPRDGIFALQIEVCRSAYLNAELSEPVPKIIDVATMLADLVRKLGDEVCAIGDAVNLRQAAE